jgi:tungstate transport system ATP-binding protein
MTALLEIKDLHIRRETRDVLRVDNLNIQSGEVLAVIGPNGAGKSTFMLTIARLLQPSDGQILFHGRPLEKENSLAYRRRIGLVLQEPLLLDISVADNVAAGLRFRGLPKAEIEARIATWMTRLGIASLRKRPARSLSGGEAQRVSLARAFALDPELLLLDEPFSALDAPTRARLLDDLQSLLAETGLTTVFITHDLNEALLLGDRVAVLLNGQLRQIGPPEQVFAMPADGEVAAFVGVETVIPGVVTESHEGQIIVEAKGLHLEAVGELQLGRSVLFCLRPEDITLWTHEADTKSTARNRLHGRICKLTPQGPLMRVELDCGFPVMALITRASAQEMHLKEELEVTASFKATAVHLISR